MDTTGKYRDYYEKLKIVNDIERKKFRTMIYTELLSTISNNFTYYTICDIIYGYNNATGSFGKVVDVEIEKHLRLLNKEYFDAIHQKVWGSSLN